MWFNGSNNIYNDYSSFPVLDGQEAADLDKFSINEKNIESRLLMGWAGYAVFAEIVQKDWFYAAPRIHILAGTGNNGGDGYVLAWQIMASTNKPVIIWQSGEPATQDAKYFCGLCSPKDLSDRIKFHEISAIQDESFLEKDIVVDAVFGTGLNKPPPENLQKIFHLVNSRGKLIRIAMDIPSGVFSNGDSFQHTAFHAHYTYSFGSCKIGHLVEPGILSCGIVKIFSIGFYPKIFSGRRLIQPPVISPLRKAGGHKYSSGVVSVIGGSSGMEGAAIMAAKSFLSLGGGLARIYSVSASIIKILNENPEFMIQSFSQTSAMENHVFESFSANLKNHVLVIGVGLKENLSADFWKKILSSRGLRMVVDGSGLGQIAAHEDSARNHTISDLILTPHKSEAERLLGRKITNVRKDALEISARYNAHVYLKGPGGILVLKNSGNFGEIYPNSRHYELSTGGTGDILSGVIANFLCRGEAGETLEAALSVYLKAASLAVEKNMHQKDFLTPSEIIDSLRMSLDHSSQPELRPT
ncbi:MAG: NAD(P)H-hydrate epimerase [Spirochaetia bacterium]|nr:NAD(P)H-hydrate epimerase [Spirochaetia bacterium]